MRSPDAERSESLVGPLLVLGAMAGFLLLGSLVRSRLGVELSPAGVQQVVGRLGWYGPLVFFGLVMFRQFLVIPVVAPPAGGRPLLRHGPRHGARRRRARGLGLHEVRPRPVGGPTWFRERFGARFHRFEHHVDRLGPW